MSQKILFPNYRIIRDFLPYDQHHQLLDDVSSHPEEFHPAAVYVEGNQQIVSDHRLAIKRVGGLGKNKELFLRYISEASDLMFAGAGMKAYPIVKMETELVANGHGGRFGRHIDTLTGWNRLDQACRGSRVVSSVYYFYNEPKGFTGGVLRIFAFGSSSEADSYVDIFPEQNSLVVFPSFASHEVLPVICPSQLFYDYRFSVNCWLHCLPG